jgi:hypothetical protein
MLKFLISIYTVTVFLQNTIVLRHVVQPERTPEGNHQRRPEENKNFQKYEVVEIEETKPAGPVKVVLLQDIEGRPVI